MKALNNKQNIQIAENRKDIEAVKEDITEIKEQVFNHIPTKIDGVNEKVNNKIDELKDKLFFGIVIAVSILVITQIILKIY